MSAVAVDCEVTGQGPPVYLVHGIGSRKAAWKELTRGLESEFTCVAYDLRGHGASPAPQTPYALADMVDDLEALRTRLGHRRINVVGHSLGGMIGPAYARSHPDRVSSVCMLSTAAGRTREDRGRLEAVGAALEDEGIAATLDTLVERWFTDAFIAARPDAIAARKKQVLDTPRDVFMSVFRIYARTEMGPWLREVPCPCLVLTGELDGGCSPRLNRFMAGELPDAELVVLDGLKHSILVEAPERVLPPVLDFLRRRGAVTSCTRA